MFFYFANCLVFEVGIFKTQHHNNLILLIIIINNWFAHAQFFLDRMVTVRVSLFTNALLEVLDMLISLLQQ